MLLLDYIFLGLKKRFLSVSDSLQFSQFRDVPVQLGLVPGESYSARPERHANERDEERRSM